MNLLNNYILVRHAKEEEKQGFQTVSAVNELIGKGECIGGDEKLIGKVIYFEKSLGTEFEINGKKVKFVKLEDVMGYE